MKPTPDQLHQALELAFNTYRGKYPNLCVSGDDFYSGLNAHFFDYATAITLAHTTRTFIGRHMLNSSLDVWGRGSGIVDEVVENYLIPAFRTVFIIPDRSLHDATAI